MVMQAGKSVLAPPLATGHATATYPPLAARGPELLDAPCERARVRLRPPASPARQHPPWRGAPPKAPQTLHCIPSGPRALSFARAPALEHGSGVRKHRFAQPDRRWATSRNLFADLRKMGWCQIWLLWGGGAVQKGWCSRPSGYGQRKPVAAASPPPKPPNPNTGGHAASAGLGPGWRRAEGVQRAAKGRKGPQNHHIHPVKVGETPGLQPSALLGHGPQHSPAGPSAATPRALVYTNR